jgi:hypothetical protein
MSDSSLTNLANGTDQSCLPLVSAVDEDFTFYRQFLWLRDASKPGRDAIHPGWIKSRLSPHSNYDDLTGTVSLALPKLAPRRKPYSIKEKFDFGLSLAKAQLSPWVVTGKGLEHARWAIGVEYRQVWQRKGLRKGRMVNSIPLGLGPTSKEIQIRSWSKQSLKRAITDAIENSSTSEVSSDEKWSLSSKKSFANQTNSSFNPSATVNQVTIPTGNTPVILGGALGISGNFSTQVNDSLERGREFIQEATFKAATSLKNSRNTTVEESSESGVETTSKEVISNPNRCNTLNYLYYEVLEEYDILTRPDRVDLFLFIPLTVNETITPEWLLQHECTLRPLLPCDTFHSGFDAARTLLVHAERETLRKALPPATQPAGSPVPDLSQVRRALNSVINKYDVLSGTTQASGVGSWLYWQLVGTVAPELRDALGVLKEQKSNMQGNLQDYEDVLGCQ